MGLHRLSSALAITTLWIIACSSAANLEAISGPDGGSDAGSDARGSAEDSGGGDSSPSVSTFSIGGTVAGLVGTGLVLQNNKGDDIVVNANGAFVFPTKLATGAPYAVTVKTQPSAPTQTCAVASGAGTTGTSDVSVVVTCSTNTFSVGGTVSGLAGTGLVLQDNFGGEVAVTADGPFTLPALPDGVDYVVTVKSQPVSVAQTCTVANGTGKLAGGNVTNVAVVCATNKYTIGGTISGLAAGNSVVLRNNSGDDLTVDADGNFTFAVPIESGANFDVVVFAQPTTPNQTCVVTGGSGSVVAGNVATVSVNCTTNKYTAGGTISGLAGTGLVLQNNGGDDIAVNVNGDFAFSPQDDGSAYNVTVKSQPNGPAQTCTVANVPGNIAGDNVTSVVVTCTTNTYTVGGNVTGLTGTLVLTNNAGDEKTITAGGPFTFATPIPSGGTYAVAVKTQPNNLWCTVTSGTGNVTNDNVSSVVVTCTGCPVLGTTTFAFTGAEQTITVPACAVKATINVSGAQGSDATVGGTGGLGGSANGDLIVTAGDVLHVFVGGRNGYNGGGAGGQIGNGQNGIKGALGPSGGGASDVRLNGTALSDRVIVAGGGGGAGTNGVWEACQTAGPAGNGGAGGGVAGLAGTAGVGTPCNCAGGGGAGGQGGTSVGGGANGNYAGNTACLRNSWTAGQSGALGQGGAGSLTYYNGTGGGGGGGGGYYGGGSGGSGSDTTPGGGGGGGSSFVGALANASTTAGVRSGNGVVTITFK